MVCRILSTMVNRNKVEDCPLSCLNNKNAKSCQLCGTEIRWRTEQLSVGVTRMQLLSLCLACFGPVYPLDAPGSCHVGTCSGQGIVCSSSGGVLVSWMRNKIALFLYWNILHMDLSKTPFKLDLPEAACYFCYINYMRICQKPHVNRSQTA